MAAATVATAVLTGELGPVGVSLPPQSIGALESVVIGPPPGLEESVEADAGDAQAQGAAQHRPIFKSYMDLEEARREYNEGKLLKGTLKVRRAKPSTAYLELPDQNDESDIVISGRNARNRAVHGDVVYVRLLDEGGDGRRSGATPGEAAAGNGASRAGGAMSGGGRTGSVAMQFQEDTDSDEDICIYRTGNARPDVDDEEDEGGDLDDPLAGLGALAADLETDRRQRSKRSGQVVAIAEPKGRNRLIVCTVHPMRKKRERRTDAAAMEDDDNTVQRTDKLLLAQPTDGRMPWILLQVNDVTKKALNIPGKLNKYELWPIQILVWNETSSLPLGRLKGQCLGEAGDLEAEVRHCLIENQLNDHDVPFEEDQLEEVDDIVAHARRDFDEECDRRLNLQHKRVFTIDPATAKDLDDAIHVDLDKERNEVEIGVHIADVAHFVKMGSLTDQEAQRRSTSVYLIDRVLPMLPHLLCNYLCSLNPNDPKLSFSVFFRLNRSTGQLVEDPAPWFAKSSISSCCRLNYDQAQDVLDRKKIEQPEVYGGHTWKEIVADLFLLYEVCGRVRTGRFEGGALTLNKAKMVFHTRESDDGIPTSYHIEQHTASHWIIEELMLLANRCVATHLAHSRFANVDAAVLRRHEPPDRRKAEKLARLLTKNLGIPWVGTTAGDIHMSFQKIYRKYGRNLGMCVEMMAMRAGMRQAEYFLYNDDEGSHHFALNFPFYTHFTSPIRRYPDVMVHRTLQALLVNPNRSSQDEGFQIGDDALHQVRICNDKRTNSRKAQEGLDRSVFCVYLRKRKEWFYTVGNVLNMHENRSEDASHSDTLTVYCSQLGREKRVDLVNEANLHRIQLWDSGVDETLLLPETWHFNGPGYVVLTWRCRETGREQRQEVRMLSSVPVVVIPTDTIPIDFAVFLVSPFHEQFRAVQKEIREHEARGFEFRQFDDDEADEDDGIEVMYDARRAPVEDLPDDEEDEVVRLGAAAGSGGGFQ